jgi:hypothetical protein
VAAPRGDPERIRRRSSPSPVSCCPGSPCRRGG